MPIVGTLPTRAAVTGAIRQAARATGASFEYLLATAQVESQPQPDRHGIDLLGQAACSSSSSRPGSRTLKEAGPALGYGRYADAIAQTSVRPLRGRRSGDAHADHEPAQRSDRQRRDGGRLHPAAMPRS